MGINYNTPAHKRLRATLISRYVPGVTLCWRCGLPITTLRTRDIHLGHDDNNPAIYKGLEHAHCNTSAGASRGNKMGPPRGYARARKTSRTW
jgi:hypothetical protein